MIKSHATLERPPQFTNNSDGKPINAAEALEEIRQIESECISEYGEFDWEKLTDKKQDDYDSLCLLLDELQEDSDTTDWEEYKAIHKESCV